jgi:Zn-dependent peptidase ImmA (M78 family)
METDGPFQVIAGHQKSIPVNVDKIARDLGIKVYKKDLGPETFGMFLRDEMRGGSSGYAIFVNSKTHSNRQRFTLAHEIAHFVLHRDLMDTQIVDNTMYRSSLSDVYETQANRLAADILMPLRSVKKAYEKEQDVTKLATQFGVSVSAMEIRIKALSRGASKP